MVFIMPSWSNCFKALGCLFLLGFFSYPVLSSEFSAVVSNINIVTDPIDNRVRLNADIDFNLSPTAKEALQKGIVLTWVVLIKIEEKGRLWNTTIEKREINYKIKNHALLNLYSVDKDGAIDMFSTLNASINALSKIRDLLIIDKQNLMPNTDFQVALKVLFDREALPIPLRPISYFDPQWALSSGWVLSK